MVSWFAVWCCSFCLLAVDFIGGWLVLMFGLFGGGVLFWTVSGQRCYLFCLFSPRSLFRLWLPFGLSGLQIRLMDSVERFGLL